MYPARVNLEDFGLVSQLLSIVKLYDIIMYVCVYVCMYVCMYVYMYVCMYILRMFTVHSYSSVFNLHRSTSLYNIALVHQGARCD